MNDMLVQLGKSLQASPGGSSSSSHLSSTRPFYILPLLHTLLPHPISIQQPYQDNEKEEKKVSFKSANPQPTQLNLTRHLKVQQEPDYQPEFHPSSSHYYPRTATSSHPHSRVSPAKDA